MKPTYFPGGAIVPVFAKGAWLSDPQSIRMPTCTTPTSILMRPAYGPRSPTQHMSTRNGLCRPGYVCRDGLCPHACMICSTLYTWGLGGTWWEVWWRPLLRSKYWDLDRPKTNWDGLASPWTILSNAIRNLPATNSIVIVWSFLVFFLLRGNHVIIYPGVTKWHCSTGSQNLDYHGWKPSGPNTTLLRISVRRLGLTTRNLNLDGEGKNGKYPELGTIFKAAHVKMIIWYLTTVCIHFAEQTKVTWYNDVILRHLSHPLGFTTCERAWPHLTRVQLSSAPRIQCCRQLPAACGPCRLCWRDLIGLRSFWRKRMLSIHMFIVNLSFATGRDCFKHMLVSAPLDGCCGRNTITSKN